MQQGNKNSQNAKVDKNLVQAKKKAIGNLMDQIGKDDDDDDSIEEKNNNKYKSNNKNYNIDFDNTQEYVPEYSKKNIENNNDLDLNDDNDIEDISPKNKPQVIKREKKVVKKEENNNTLHMRSGIKRTIKQQEEITSTFSNTYSKPNFQREKKDSNYLETSDIKDNNYTYVSFNKTKYKLPVEKDNSIKIFWYDAIEESFNNKPNIIFFGKIYEPQSNSFLSISVIIKDIFRTVFILPKPEYEDKIQQVYEEFDDLRKKRFNYIKEYQCKFEKKKNIVLNYLLIQKKSILY